MAAMSPSCASTAKPAASTVERYCIAYDIGRAINPALVHGQIVGGFAQGLGGALFEEFTYSERGDPLAVTLADYLLPAMHETPEPEVLLREDYTTPLNPLGIKGAGESGITAVGASDRLGDRRRDRHSRRGARASGHAATAEANSRQRAGTSVATRQNPLLGLDAGELHHLGPLLGLAARRPCRSRPPISATGMPPRSNNALLERRLGETGIDRPC